ncbi:MAG: alpha/beta hydrolase family protein [Gemmataceae bacterium]
MLRTVSLFALLASSSIAWAQPKDNIIAPVRDARYGKPKDYNGYFPWTPPRDTKDWDKRRDFVRRQLLVSQGLWPLPEKTPLNPTIHGKIERDGYTVEKVFFASLPGHYVCGNLYRPTGKTGKLPAVLCPHGHWANGRLYENGDAGIKREIKTGAEQTEEGAKYPLQARCAQLARMGCVVFFYDMVGYADSKQIGHRDGFYDHEAELRLQNFMGLQTWNSIRALDFLTSLPEVDGQRVGVTGASGGGTQTFVLCSVDDRPAVQVPAVMVSTSMQGGCVCENCSLLRVNTGNIELAGLWAPRPLAMIGADDWTKEIETKGYPELKALYRLYGKDENVLAKAFTQFPHNYNQVSREFMYAAMNKHLKLGFAEPIKEQKFVPVAPKDLVVYNSEHPLPKDATGIDGTRKWMTAQSEKSLKALLPKDDAGKQKYRDAIGGALKAMVVDELPAGSEVVEVIPSNLVQKDDALVRRDYVLSRKGAGERVRAVGICRKNFDGRMIVWIHPDGPSSLWNGKDLTPEAKEAVDSGAAIFAPELFRTGPDSKLERPGNVMTIGSNKFAGYTFGYNRSLMADRVHDILTSIAYVKNHRETKSVHLAGFGKAGPWALTARALAGDAVGKTVIDVNRFKFEDIKSMDDENLLPGALRYGGLPAFAALVAPQPLLVYNAQDAGSSEFPHAMYGDNGAAERRDETLPPLDAVRWILK